MALSGVVAIYRWTEVFVVITRVFVFVNCMMWRLRGDLAFLRFFIASTKSAGGSVGAVIVMTEAHAGLLIIL